MSDGDRLAQLWARLDRVTDPELDESVTELGFVTGLAADEQGRVSIGFRLPTYWCAANFAFMMAADMRAAALSLDWVTGVDLHLDEHMYGEAINDGLARGLSFQEAFGGDASGDLDELRRIFLLKSFQRRQEALLSAMLERGIGPEAIAALARDALPGMFDDARGALLVRRYLERRDLAGAADAAASALAFVDVDGAALLAPGLRDYLKALRRVGVNAEFNGAICRGLLAARYDDAPRVPSAEPTLVDFVRAAARERAVSR